MLPWVFCLDRQRFSALPGGSLLLGEWLGCVITLFNSRGAAKSWLHHFTLPPRAMIKCGSQDSKFSPTFSIIPSSFQYNCPTGHTSRKKKLCRLMISEVSVQVSRLHWLWPRWGGPSLSQVRVAEAAQLAAVRKQTEQKSKGLWDKEGKQAWVEWWSSVDQSWGIFQVSGPLVTLVTLSRGT